MQAKRSRFKVKSGHVLQAILVSRQSYCFTVTEEVGYRLNDTILGESDRQWVNLKKVMQGGPSAREPGLGKLGFWEFHCLPNSTSADGAEVAGQEDKMVERRNRSRPNPGSGAGGPPSASMGIQIYVPAHGTYYTT